MADNHGENCIDHDCRVIEFTYALRLNLIIFFNDNKIKPTSFPLIRFHPIKHVNEEAQEEKYSEENNRFTNPEKV